MTGATTWWWVRHAPVIGATGAIYGQTDVDCDTSEAAAFRALSASLPQEAVWLTTPLRRTQQTFAAISAAAAGSPPTPDIEPAFAEQCFGAWETLDWNQMQRLDPAIYAAFWENPTHNAPPGGESFAHLMARVAAAIDHRSSQHQGRTIVAIAHGGAIRAAVAHALDLSAETAMALVIDNLSVTRLTLLPEGILHNRGGQWRVETVNAPCRWIPPAGSC